jgi:AcrR family transcriptional regulator
MTPARSRGSAAKPRKRPAQQRSRETVRVLLEAAARVFEERGTAAATTDAIAERAGVSVGSLYQYFPNKESLLATLAACHVLEVRAAILPALAALDAATPFDVALRRFVRAMVALHTARPRLHRALFTEVPYDTESIRALLALQNEICARLARWLAHRAEVRLADPALAARLAVDALVGLAHGFALDRRAGGTPADREAETETLLRRYFTASP